MRAMSDHLCMRGKFHKQHFAGVSRTYAYSAYTQQNLLTICNRVFSQFIWLAS